MIKMKTILKKKITQKNKKIKLIMIQQIQIIKFKKKKILMENKIIKKIIQVKKIKKIKSKKLNKKFQNMKIILKNNKN